MSYFQEEHEKVFKKPEAKVLLPQIEEVTFSQNMLKEEPHPYLACFEPI